MRQLLGVAILAMAASQAGAQVSSETVLDSAGYATTMVQNGSAEVLDVEVELRHGAVTRDRIDLGERVEAVVSPSRFRLAPGESQLVRLLVREPLAADSVVRLVTTLTPRDAREVSRTEGGAVAQLRFATRLVTRVRAQ
jgi:P pilus assembly chaperone PapD